MFGASGNSRSPTRMFAKINVAGNKFPHLIFAAQFPNARPADLIFFANARESEILFCGVRWHTKNANVPVGFFLAFFYAGAHIISYMFFCLDAKEPKNQGCDALAKNRLRYAKM